MAQGQTKKLVCAVRVYHVIVPALLNCKLQLVSVCVCVEGSDIDIQSPPGFHKYNPNLLATSKNNSALDQQYVSSIFVVVLSELAHRERQNVFVCVLYFRVSLRQGCTNPGRLVIMASKYCTVALNIFEPSVWNLFPVVLLAPVILRWCVDLWKDSMPLV